MKLLVTGGCGFLGSHVCQLFRDKGWNVIAFDNLTKFEYRRTGYNPDTIRRYSLQYLTDIGVLTITGDILRYGELLEAVKGCDLVVHCAAQPAMTISIENPRLDFEVNTQGTLNVLEACERSGNIPMVSCSTIHVYGNGINSDLVEYETRMFNYRNGEIGETYTPIGGLISPLHASKRAAELYVQAYIDTYHLPAANFRLTGIYGPRQFGGEDHGWIANFAIKTILGQPIKIFGTDKQVRDILYVKDAAQAFFFWYEAGCPSGTYNIGGGEETSISIRELLDLLEEITGKRSEVTREPRRYGDLWWFISDYTKAMAAFGWSPLFLPREGLQLLVDWAEKERRLFE